MIVAAGVIVALDDVILGQHWAGLKAEVHDLPFALVVRARDLDTVLRRAMTRVGAPVDRRDRTPDETIDDIARRLGTSVGSSWLRRLAAAGTLPGGWDRR